MTPIAATDERSSLEAFMTPLARMTGDYPAFEDVASKRGRAEYATADGATHRRKHRTSPA